MRVRYIRARDFLLVGRVLFVLPAVSSCFLLFLFFVAFSGIDALHVKGKVLGEEKWRRRVVGESKEVDVKATRKKRFRTMLGISCFREMSGAHYPLFRLRLNLEDRSSDFPPFFFLFY